MFALTSPPGPPAPHGRSALSALVELSEQPICQLNRDGVVCAVNPAFVRMMEPTRLLGASLRAQVHPDDHPLLASLMAGDGVRAADRAAGEDATAQAAAPGRAVGLRLRGADGGFDWVRFTAITEGDRLIMLVNNIMTPEAGVGRRGLSFQARHDMLMATFELGTWYFDIANQRLFWNETTRKHFGLAPHTSVDIDLFVDLVHPDDREATMAAFATAIEDCGRYDAVYRVQGRDGVERVIHAIGQAFSDSPGKVSHCDGITLDITEAKQTERALARSLQVRDNFLAIASHELRTPLTGTLLQLNLLERRLGRGNDRPVVDRFVSHLHQQIARLVHLVDEIIDISRISSDNLKIAPRRIDLSALVSQVAEAQRSQLAQVGCVLTVEPGPRLFAYADTNRLSQALSNILDNAARYAPQTPVTVRMRRHRGHAAIEVADGGGGILPPDQERIFGKFERAVSRHERSGLGLGLTISRHILRAHQGDLVVESASGAGATFILTLPMVS